MAEHHPSEGSSTSHASAESCESTVELNIKTLDSQMYSFNVDKNIPVSVFKEKIASKIGVPVRQQRLIFRGKVLKDNHILSEYHLNNGHMLHLVVRQPSQPQSSSGNSIGESTAESGNRGMDASAGGPRIRLGQVSHSVVLGTFNVGEQSEGAVPDLSRPFPLQTSSLFGGPISPLLNLGAFVPGGVGPIPRREYSYTYWEIVSLEVGTVSGDSGQTHVLPMRNIIAAAVPLRPSVSVSSAAQHGESSVVQDQPESGAGSGERNNDIISLLGSIGETSLPLPGIASVAESQAAQAESHKPRNKEDTEGAVRADVPSSSSVKRADNQSSEETVHKSVDGTGCAPRSSQGLTILRVLQLLLLD